MVLAQQLWPGEAPGGGQGGSPDVQQVQNPLWAHPDLLFPGAGRNRSNCKSHLKQHICFFIHSKIVAFDGFPCSPQPAELVQSNNGEKKFENTVRIDQCSHKSWGGDCPRLSRGFILMPSPGKTLPHPPPEPAASIMMFLPHLEASWTQQKSIHSCTHNERLQPKNCSLKAAPTSKPWADYYCISHGGMHC